MRWRRRGDVEEQIQRSNDVLREMAEIVLRLQTNADRLEECLEQIRTGEEEQ